jgi:Gas vesicle protein
MATENALLYQPVPLVDLLDRVLATGVVITGDITISIAEVDLVRISLRALVASVGALAENMVEEINGS